MSEARLFPLAGDQRPAVEPEDTVWLSASAGTGKTQVLSSRVLRLLLQPGVRPESLLCLTFTKAGAAEMATRVHEVMASWVRLDDEALALQLLAIGAEVTPETRARARSRFAAVLDCPGGGLRIETIHAFAQWLLAAFPAEAGIMPGARAMEERDRELLLRQVLAELLVGAQERGDPALSEALAVLSVRMTQEQIEGWLLRCAEARELWFGTGAWQPPLRPRIDRLLGLGEGACADDLAGLCGDDGFDCASLRACLQAQVAWATKTGLGTAEAVHAWLGSPTAQRAETLDQLQKALFTDKGEPRSLKHVLKHEPGYAEFIERVRSCIGRVQERRGLLALADYLEPALTLGRAFALAWDEAKQREGFIDFDDLIRHAADLLNGSGVADWVRFKLDRRFDHILVDEAQDTNAAQWAIVYALIDDFFSGAGQRGEVMRTLFVVGDYKQAIFRFQGTSPENFERAKERVREQMAGIDRKLRELGLERSFRTARPILEFVDRAIAAIGPARFGLAGAPDPHRGEERPGTVTMWPVVAESGEGNGSGADEADEGEEGWLSRHDRQLADKIARQVRAWLDHGFPLVKGGERLAGAGDVMVLVRRRKELAGLIVARLHAHGVPVAGVDRLRLGAPLGVKDAVAALRFAAQPLDSLNLAALLVSPLIGWSQEDLLAWGYRNRRVELWDHLRAEARPETLAAREQLLALLRRADYETPQELLHWILAGPWQGRRKLAARLGSEVNDPLDELLNAAMAYATGSTISLVGFLQWFDASEGELKREAGRSEGLVRVMTVHGAKGLQAPIVILADAADDPDASPPRSLSLPEPVPGREPRQVPLPPLRKAEKVGAVAMAEERAASEEREEHWRLLYVAMTRAEEALFIAGSLSRRRKDVAPDSWYAALQPLFAGSWESEDAIWNSRSQVGEAATLSGEHSRAEARSGDELLPEWLNSPVASEPRPPRPLAPSSLGEQPATGEAPARPAADRSAAARRGILLHRLLERLPELRPDQRLAAATAWLARTAPELGENERTEIASAASGILADPRWLDLFGPGSLAEVPVAAVVGEQVIAGTVDRLVVTPDLVRIVDYKSSRRPPASMEAIPVAYLRQMAAYAAALEVVYPGRRIAAALLYTECPRMFELPAELLAQHKPGSQAGEESFSG